MDPSLTIGTKWDLKRVFSNWAQTPLKPKRWQNVPQLSPQPPYKNLGKGGQDWWGRWSLWEVQCLWWKEILFYEGSFEGACRVSERLTQGLVVPVRWKHQHFILHWWSVSRECANPSCAYLTKADRAREEGQGREKGSGGAACIRRKLLRDKVELHLSQLAGALPEVMTCLATGDHQQEAGEAHHCGHGRRWHDCYALTSENNTVWTPYRALWNSHLSRLWEG